MNRFLSFTALLVLVVISSGSSKAQIKKESKTIVINNGDTIINGKSLSKVDKQTRKELLEEFREIEKRMPRISSKENEIIIRRKGDKEKEIEVTTDGKNPHILFWDDETGTRKFPNNRVFRFDRDGDSLNFRLYADSLFKNFNFRMEKLDSIPGRSDMRWNFRRNFPGDENGPGFYPNDRNFFPMLGLKKNSSQFSYNYVDKDGIEDHISVSLSDVSPEQFKKVSGGEESSSTLDVKDLTLFPDYSSGALNLTFKVSSSGNTRIRIMDSSYKEVFSDSDIIVSGPYLKSVGLSRNGIYFLAINQGARWYIKRLVRQ